MATENKADPRQKAPATSVAPSPGGPAGAAETVSDREANRALEDTQARYEQRHGKRGSDEEIRAFEATDAASREAGDTVPDLNEKARLAEADQKFREDMEAKAKMDPDAQRWVDADRRAQTHEQSIESLQRDADGRGQGVNDAEAALTQARTERDDWLAENERPMAFNIAGRRAWDAEKGAHDNAVKVGREALKEAAERAEPEAIEQAQERIREQQAELGKSMAERQDIAKLPSEKAQAQDGEGNAQQQQPTQQHLERLDALMNRPLSERRNGQAQGGDAQRSQAEGQSAAPLGLTDDAMGDLRQRRTQRQGM
jgi:hypothetical protein